MNHTSKHIRLLRRLMHRDDHPRLRLCYLIAVAVLRLHPRGAWTYLRVKTRPKTAAACAPAIRLRGNRTIRLRDTETDLSIFEQIFLLDDCAVPRSDDQILRIMDAGAHIGCSSLYFAARYPDARIIAIEADARNYRQLVLNTASVPNITAIHGAVFHVSTQVAIVNPGDRPWGFQVGVATGPAAENTLSAHTVPELMEMAGFTHIDLLKIDIEGAERELFAHGGETWLRRVRILVVEMHDEIKAGCTDSFRRAIASIPHELVQRLDNLIWRNLGPLP